MKRTRARPGDGVEGAQQRREVRRLRAPAALQVEAVGVDVLAEQRDLAHAVGDEGAHLGHDGLERRGCARGRARCGTMQ